MSIQITSTHIPEVLYLIPERFEDERGFFMETYRTDILSQHGISFEPCQENLSQSRHGVLRGLHHQLEVPQGKLVRVLQGEIFDVAVDIRRSSPTFGHWGAARLSDRLHDMLWIPPGFSHGFYVLSQQATIAYTCTAPYLPNAQAKIRWNDPSLAITWPIDADNPPILSTADAGALDLEQADLYP